MSQRNLIYLCKKNVTLSSSCSCRNKRIFIETITWGNMPLGKICMSSNSDIMRWGSNRCYSTIPTRRVLLPSYQYRYDGDPLQKSFRSVSTSNNLQREKKTTKEKRVSQNPESIKKAYTIKKLYNENKKLFGELLETKTEKVKRTQKETKMDAAKILVSQKVTDGLQGKQEDEPTIMGKGKSSFLNPRSLPRVESVRLEHAGMSINKNRKVDAQQDNASTISSRKSAVRAHKGAEVKWALKYAPTKMKLIELSRDEPGHVSSGVSPLPIEEDAGSFQTFEDHQTKTSPSVEQLIKSFYDTDDRQVRPRSTVRKISNGVSSTKSSENDCYASEPFNNEEYNTNATVGQEVEVSDRKNNDGNKNITKLSTNTSKPPQARSRSDYSMEPANDPVLSFPYYNPERNLSEHQEEGENIGRTSSNCDDYDKDASDSNKLIASFPFPSYSALKERNSTVFSTTNSSSTFIASGVVDNNNDNKLIMTSGSSSLQQQQPPLALPKVPSVSKILSTTMPEEQAQALKRWEQKMITEMGEEGFRRYKESIFSNGKSLHRNIETYLRGTSIEDILIAEPNQGHWRSINGILASIDHVQVLESHVIHPKLEYCGIVDCVAEFRNRLVLIDWKTSQKPKPFVSMTYDTPLQIAAYIGAINCDPKYSLKIDDGLIVVAYEDGSSCQTFSLSSKDIEKYWKKWLQRLKLYRQLNVPA